MKKRYGSMYIFFCIQFFLMISPLMANGESAEEENLFHPYLFKPLPWVQFRSLWWQRPHEDLEKIFQLKDGVMTLGIPKGQTGRAAAVRIQLDYETSEFIDVSYEYRTSGNVEIRVEESAPYSDYQVSESGRNHSSNWWMKDQLLPSGEWKKVNCRIPRKEYRNLVYSWFLRGAPDATLQIRGLKAQPIEPRKTAGKPFLLDGKKANIIYYTAKDEVEERYHRRSAKVLRSTLCFLGCEWIPVQKYKGQKLENAILITSPGAENGKNIKRGGYSLDVKNGVAKIIGRRPGGTELGVLGLWEKTGIRFITPFDYVGKNELLRVPSGKETVNPGVALREIAQGRLLQSARLGFHDVKGANLVGEKDEFDGDSFHTLSFYLPKNEIKKTHPEFYAKDTNGKPLEIAEVQGHYCYNNKELQKLLLERVLYKMEYSKECTVFQIGIGDGVGGYCRCEKCSKMAKPEPYLRMMNLLARETVKKFPDKYLSAAIYVDTGKPLANLPPEKNVMFNYCPYNPYHNNWLQWDHYANQEGLENLALAEKLAPGRMSAYTYPLSCSEALHIFPRFYYTCAERKRFSENGYYNVCDTGKFCKEGTIFSANNFGELLNYVISRIEIDPKTEIEKETDFFMKHYYGPAAPEMRTYFDLIHKEVKERDFYCEGEFPRRGFVTPEFARKAYPVFEKAERKVKNDPKYYSRVRAEKKYLLWTDLMDNNIGNGRVTAEEHLVFLEKLADFSRTCREEKSVPYHFNIVTWFWKVARIKIEDTPYLFYEKPTVKRLMENSRSLSIPKEDNEQVATKYGFKIPVKEMIGSGVRKTSWYRNNEIEVRQLFREGSGSDIVRCYLKLKTVPEEEITMKIYGIDNEKKDPAQMIISVNGKTLFSGNVPWEKENWKECEFRIPANLLKAGANLIAIRNITPESNSVVRGINKADFFWGWFMISDIDFHLSKRRE